MFIDICHIKTHEVVEYRQILDSVLASDVLTTPKTLHTHCVIIIDNKEMYVLMFNSKP